MIAPFLLLCLLAPFRGAAPVRDDPFAAAQSKFVRVAAGDSLDEKRAALEELIRLADPAAAAVLATEYGRAAEELRRQREALLRARYALDRRQIVLENLKLLSQRDPSAKDLFPREEERIAELRKELARSEKKVEHLEPWRDALADGMARLFDALGPARRRKSEQEVVKDAQEHPDTLLRAASIELVGRVGGPGTVLYVHDLMLEADESIDKLRVRIAKAMGDVRKMEKRMQEEQAESGGRMATATEQQYEAIKKEAGQATSQMFLLEVLVEACQRAGGIALAREGGKDLEKSLQKLVASLKKGKDRSRIDTLRLLLRARTDEVRAQVRALLAAETEALGLGTLIDGLAGLGDDSIVPELISRYLTHESWYVRARAAHALATLRSRDAVPAMIARLEKEDGRVRTDLNQALQSLTGQAFQASPPIWQRWWTEHGETFQVVEAAPPKTALEEAKESTGVTFFGITTESQRVLFVLDLSGSMDFSMVPKNNPDDSRDKPFDMPEPGEPSRLDVAKRDLVKAIGGLKDGAAFHLVLFASDVWTWSDDLATMNAEVRAEVFDYVENVDAVGGTNVYGALERAFDLAGANGGGQWSEPVVDTIYFLTDGRASVGVTTDPEEILAYVRQRNGSAGITLHTIGLSDAHDAVLLRRMAEENGGTYVGR
jgi:HEAT repeat protein